MRYIAALFFLVIMAGTVLAAGAYDIKQMTPQVQSALDGRKQRFAQLKSLKAQGVLGENNRGYVEVLGAAADARALADDENRDRKAIYEAIVVQNNLGKGALATVEGVFAEVQRQKASAGDRIQSQSGEWVIK
jgi:uncharacterized protein YdbL (DUF1318 family)